jgi:SAM-dependent methyltransferase
MPDSANDIRRTRSATFNDVAQLYDATRPSYPPELAEAVIDLARLPEGAAILEIGCGTGKATTLFAPRGYAIRCLEPGRNLAAVAAENLRAYPQVVIEQTKFEDWPLQAGQFDLVMSAQAFHWVAPEIRYPKAAQALKDSGHIALFWNRPPDEESDLRRQLDVVYRTNAPSLARSPDHRFEAELQEIAAEIAGSGYFTDVVVRQFPWSAYYATRQYLDLLDTYSDHRLLPAATKRALFDGVAEVLSRNGGGIDKPYVGVLYVARKRS